MVPDVTGQDDSLGRNAPRRWVRWVVTLVSFAGFGVFVAVMILKAAQAATESEARAYGMLLVVVFTLAGCVILVFAMYARQLARLRVLHRAAGPGEVVASVTLSSEELDEFCVRFGERRKLASGVCVFTGDRDGVHLWLGARRPYRFASAPWSAVSQVGGGGANVPGLIGDMNAIVVRFTADDTSFTTAFALGREGWLVWLRDYRTSHRDHLTATVRALWIEATDAGES